MTEDLSLNHDVRAALDRVVASDEFRASPNLNAFLRFIVERTLDGREETIKAYTVATEVLGRPNSFDPQIDPIVRVEATRLRRSLERYYARTADPLLITIPRGSYVPQFARVDPSAAAAAAPTAEPPPPPPLVPMPSSPVLYDRERARHGRLRTATAAVLLVTSGLGLGLFALPWFKLAGTEWTGREPIIPTISALTTPADAAIVPGRTRPSLSLTAFGTVMVAPVQGTSAAAKVHADIVTDLLRDALARFEDVVVVEVAGEQPGALPSPSDDAYLLTGRLTRLGASSKVALRLRHEVSQQIVWSGEYTLAVGDGPGLSETAMLRRVVTAIAAPTGVIAGDNAAAKRRADPMNVPAACLLEAGSWLDPTRPDRSDLVTSCLQRTVSDYPRLASGWAVLARTTLERYRLGGAADDVLLSQALSQAMTAQALAPQSARAQQVLSDVLASRGDARGANAAIERALELNPNSSDALQSAGFRRIESGDYEGGLARLGDVGDAGAPGSPWRSLYCTIGLSRVPGNQQWLADFQDPAIHPAALLSTMIAKGASFQANAARAASDRLTQHFPNIARDTSGFLRRLGFGAAAAKAVSGELAAANVTSSKS